MGWVNTPEIGSKLMTISRKINLNLCILLGKGETWGGVGGYGWVEGDEVLGISREIFDNFPKISKNFPRNFRKTDGIY